MADGEAGRGSARPPRWAVAASVGRALAVVAALLLLYALLPLTAAPPLVALTGLGVGLVVFGVLVVRQFVAIERSRRPGLRAAEALAVAVPLFLLLFAATYVRLSEVEPAAFSEPLDRIDALYFTVTTFATVGFGDVVATSRGARALVTGQVVGDLLVLGLIVNAMVGAARRTRHRRDT